VAAAAVLTTDAHGRLRFTVPVLTTDAQGRPRFAVPGGEVPTPAAAGWSGEIGATLPLCDPKDGMTRWDPLGLSKGISAAKFDKFRAAELKHGRVAMVAVVGLLSQHYVRLKYLVTSDGVLDLGEVPSGFGAISTAPASAAFALIVLMAGFFELGVLSDKGRAPGDFGDPLNWREQLDYLSLDDATLKTYELEHGRLAMLGVMGTLAAEYVTGYDAVGQWEHAAAGAGRLIQLTVAGQFS